MTLRNSHTAIPRSELVRRGYRAFGKSRDMQRWGYQIVEWFCPATKAILIEYIGVTIFDQEYGQDGMMTGRPAQASRVDVPRYTATTYAEQVAVHRALGLHVVRPGEEWRPIAEGQGVLPWAA